MVCQLQCERSREMISFEPLSENIKSRVGWRRIEVSKHHSSQTHIERNETRSTQVVERTLARRPNLNIDIKCICRCVHSVSLTEHSIKIQDKRGGLLALDNLSTNQWRHSTATPPIAPPAAPTSLHRYTNRPNPAMNSSIPITYHNPYSGPPKTIWWSVVWPAEGGGWPAVWVPSHRAARR